MIQQMRTSKHRKNMRERERGNETGISVQLEVSNFSRVSDFGELSSRIVTRLSGKMVPPHVGVIRIYINWKE